MVWQVCFGTCKDGEIFFFKHELYGFFELLIWRAPPKIGQSTRFRNMSYCRNFMRWWKSTGKALKTKYTKSLNVGEGRQSCIAFIISVCKSYASMTSSSWVHGVGNPDESSAGWDLQWTHATLAQPVGLLQPPVARCLWHCKILEVDRCW